MATSTDRELDHALTGVRKDMIRQIEDEKTKRELRKRRHRDGGPLDRGHAARQSRR